jgi:hypothetical protein
MRRFLLVLAMAVLVLARPVRSQDDGKDEGSQLMQSLVTLLRQELDLNDDQVGKVTTVLEKGMTHLFVNMLARQNGEDPDDDLVKDEIMDGLRGVVDDAQRKELDVLLHEFETQTGRFQLGVPDEDNLDLDTPFAPSADKIALSKNADLWFEGDLPTAERLALKADNILILSEDEKKVVLPRVKAVVEARRALRDERHERRKSLGIAAKAGASKGECKERLHGLRRKTVELENRLSKAEDELREVVTLEQEARLVAVGILD